MSSFIPQTIDAIPAESLNARLGTPELRAAATKGCDEFDAASKLLADLPKVHRGKTAMDALRKLDLLAGIDEALIEAAVESRDDRPRNEIRTLIAKNLYARLGAAIEKPLRAAQKALAEKLAADADELGKVEAKIAKRWGAAPSGGLASELARHADRLRTESQQGSPDYSWHYQPRLPIAATFFGDGNALGEITLPR